MALWGPFPSQQDLVAVWASDLNEVSYWLSQQAVGNFGSVKFRNTTTGSPTENVRLNAIIVTVETGSMY